MKLTIFCSLISLSCSQFPSQFGQNNLRTTPSQFQNQNLAFPPLRSENDGTSLVIPLSSRFMVRSRNSVPTTTTSTSTPSPQIISVQPYQVLSHTDVREDDGETWHEGPLDLESRLATRLAWKAFEEDINQRIEGEMMWVPLEVISAEGQVVSGVLYNMRVLAGTSNCSRYEVNTHSIQNQNCVHLNGAQKGIFNILISEKSQFWSPFIPDTARIFSVLEEKMN